MRASRDLVVLTLAGMRNNACRELVVEALERVPGVSNVSVSLIRARAVVQFAPPCEPRALIAAVTNLGYGAALSLPGLSGRAAPEDVHLPQGGEECR